MDTKYEIGQKLNLERNPIYADNMNGAKLQETTREISKVMEIDEDRTGIQFKGSKVWFQIYNGSEWLSSMKIKYRII